MGLCLGLWYGEEKGDTRGEVEWEEWEPPPPELMLRRRPREEP